MSENSQLYCTFRLAGRWYGVPIEDVKEVTAETTHTRIPHAPGEVAGYVNIRGHIFLALELARLLGAESQATAHGRFIIFKQAVGPSFGVLVDEIDDIVAVDASQTEPFNAGGAELEADEPAHRVSVIDKVCRLPTELLIVLEPRKFLGIVEQSIAAAG